MNLLRSICLLLSLAILSGCQHFFGYRAKLESEKSCPTDIRQMVPWCVGEDAIFRCPCGPSCDFHGYKPTCWGVWPAPGAQWRDAYCGPLVSDHGSQCESCFSEPTDPGLVLLPSPAEELRSSEVTEEIQLGNPAAEKSLPLPQQSVPLPQQEEQQEEQTPLVPSDLQGEAYHSDRSIQNAGIDYSFSDEVHLQSFRKARNSLEITGIESHLNSRMSMQHGGSIHQVKASEEVTKKQHSTFHPNHSSNWRNGPFLDFVR